MHEARAVPFADLALSRRLDRAEGYACAGYAEARRRLVPDSGAGWIECAGACAVFDGVDSPVTQTFGLGLFEELSPDALDVIERFFRDRGAPVFHEVSPFAGVAALSMLCSRQYQPIEISTVLYQAVDPGKAEPRGSIRVRSVGPDERDTWSDICARGWSHEHPELREFLLDIGRITAAREQSLCFLAELDGQPGAVGVLCFHEGVALFGGATTIPELRRRGLQAALLRERMRCAADYGCDVAMMVAQPGSDSQRNAERNGFRVAYTRTKWRL